MASSSQFFLSCFWFCLLFHPQIARSLENYCPLSFCGDNIVKFPFQLKNRPTSSPRCVYPGFDLSCNRWNNKTILNLTNSGPFVVEIIDYMTQSLWITDPENCLPKRLLRGFSLAGSPFNQEQSLDVTFLNCSSSVTTNNQYHRVVSCLSGQNYTVLAGPSWFHYNESTLPSSCETISTVPIPWRLWSGIEVGVELSWRQPSCGNCEELGRACRFKNSNSLDTGCSDFSRLAISRNTKYSIALGVGIPAVCCMIGLGCYLCSRIRAAGQRHRLINTELSTSSFTLRPSIMQTGLDGPTIESYPTTLLGESKRLPNPNYDNTCSICLSEYQAKETLRTIPECNHYFHADCIDEWLKMKASCPMCRNSPDVSTVWTSSSASSSRPSTSSV